MKPRFPGDPRWAYALVNLATLIWSTNIILGRVVSGQIGPLTLTAIRFTIAGLLYLLLVRKAGSGIDRLSHDWPMLLGMGLTGVLGFSSLLYLSLRHTTASNAALINGAGPLITTLLAAAVLREKLTPGQVLGALLSLAGVAWIVSGNPLAALAGRGPNLGDLLVFIAVVLWGIYSVLGRVVLKGRSTISATAWSIWLALPFLYPSATVEWLRSPGFPPVYVLLAAVYIGIFPSVISYISWNEAVRRVGPSQTMAFYNMLPVYGVILSVVLLGESLALSHLVGGGLVIAGGMITVWPDLRR